MFETVSHTVPRTVPNEEEEDEEDSTFLPDEISTDYDEDADFTVVTEVNFRDLEDKINQPVAAVEQIDLETMIGTPKRKEKEKEVVELDIAMSNVSLSDRLQVAHPFNMSQYLDDNGDKCVGIFLLCFSGAKNKQYEVKVSDDGKLVDVEYTYPKIMFDASKLTFINPNYNKHSSRFQAFNKAAEAMKIQYNNKVVGVQRFRLPFPVLKDYTRIAQIRISSLCVPLNFGLERRPTSRLIGRKL